MLDCLDAIEYPLAGAEGQSPSRLAKGGNMISTWDGELGFRVRILPRGDQE